VHRPQEIAGIAELTIVRAGRSAVVPAARRFSSLKRYCELERNATMQPDSNQNVGINKDSHVVNPSRDTSMNCEEHDRNEASPAAGDLMRPTVAAMFRIAVGLAQWTAAEQAWIDQHPEDATYVRELQAALPCRQSQGGLMGEGASATLVVRARIPGEPIRDQASH
jgi:hypothetical protein